MIAQLLTCCPAISTLLPQTGEGGKRHGRCKHIDDWEYDTHWIEPAAINYREITDWPHLNKCLSTLEVIE